MSNNIFKSKSNQNNQNKVNVLFVCMGNICRSPTAEGVFQNLIQKHSLENRISVDSAGTFAFHAGEVPDKRARDAAAKRGYDLSKIKARMVEKNDFLNFNYVLAMDLENLQNLKELAKPNTKAQVKLFLDYAAKVKVKEVPDPYYGGMKGFEKVLDLVEEASLALLMHILKTDLGVKK